MLVATDAIGGLRSAQAGAVIARAWVDAVPGSQVAVVAVGEAGAGFLSALTDVHATAGTLAVGLAPAGQAQLSTQPGAPVAVDLTASSYALGAAVAAALRGHQAAAGSAPEELVIDLGGLGSHDGGAGLLAGLGATADVSLTDGVAGLAGLSRLDLDPVRALLGDTKLVGVVPHDERDLVLLGLRGITSRHRTPGGDPAVLLATDASLATLARLTGPAGTDRAAIPGAGAVGGASFVVLALGGELTTGTGYLADRVGLDRTLGRSDVLVTGCTVFDFATRGGGAVAQLALRAGSAMRPCIAIAGEVLVGGRELRTMGIESAYAVGTDGLAETAQRVARTWSW